jgi:hypothetical protein
MDDVRFNEKGTQVTLSKTNPDPGPLDPREGDGSRAMADARPRTGGREPGD